MEAVVLRAMAKAPEERYQRASDLGAALLGALIASHTSEEDPYSSPPSLGRSLPTGLDIIAPPIGPARHSERPGDGPPPWAQRSSVAGQGSRPFEPGGSASRAGSWDEGRQQSSITGMLPDLNIPIASLEEPPPSGYSAHSGAPTIQYPPSGARSGQWGSFAGSQATGSGSGIGSSSLANSRTNSHATGRMPIAGARSGASYPTAGPQMRATVAPVTSRPLPEALMDSRAALPGSRMTDPPDGPPVRLRSTRLWIGIAVLLIIMLVAVIALLRFFQMSQGVPLH
jgi:hypothetical protein